VFGPVSVLIKFSNIKEACSISNYTDYGLQAGIFTHNMENVLYALKNLQFMVNESSDFRVDMMPFGGFKASGLGREGARNAIEAMTEIKCVVYNMKELERNLD
jgi:glyceraldehyde-3-phosphate dehydrogenase (NADP+)